MYDENLVQAVLVGGATAAVRLVLFTPARTWTFRARSCKMRVLPLFSAFALEDGGDGNASVFAKCFLENAKGSRL